jgi:hypothetical protein
MIPDAQDDELATYGRTPLNATATATAPPPPPPPATATRLDRDRDHIRDHLEVPGYARAP